MKCKLCNIVSKGSEQWAGLRYDKINSKEYEERIKDGRATWLSPICPKCYKDKIGEKIMTLQEINNSRL